MRRTSRSGGEDAPRYITGRVGASPRSLGGPSISSQIGKRLRATLGGFSAPSHERWPDRSSSRARIRRDCDEYREYASSTRRRQRSDDAFASRRATSAASKQVPPQRAARQRCLLVATLVALPLRPSRSGARDNPQFSAAMACCAARRSSRRRVRDAFAAQTSKAAAPAPADQSTSCCAENITVQQACLLRKSSVSRPSAAAISSTTSAGIRPPRHQPLLSPKATRAVAEAIHI